MAKFRCSVCGYIYDESSHDLPFSSVDDSYVCPVCSAKKSAFEEMADKATFGDTIPVGNFVKIDKAKMMDVIMRKVVKKCNEYAAQHASV